MEKARKGIHALLGPFVLPADLVFLLGSEVVLDVEGLTDFFRSLTLDHVGDGLAADVEKGLDIEVICSLRFRRMSVSGRGNDDDDDDDGTGSGSRG